MSATPGRAFDFHADTRMHTAAWSLAAFAAASLALGFFSSTRINRSLVCTRKHVHGVCNYISASNLAQKRVLPGRVFIGDPTARALVPADDIGFRPINRSRDTRSGGFAGRRRKARAGERRKIFEQINKVALESARFHHRRLLRESVKY